MALRYELVGPDRARLLTDLRLEVLRAVNGLPEEHPFAADTVAAIDAYWHTSDHLTAVAFADGVPVGCATMCYIRLMPTFDHPTGLRGHLMNVYTRPAFRRQGIARQLVNLLLADARARGATEVSLDATEDGRRLYASMGFTANGEGMVLLLK